MNTTTTAPARKTLSLQGARQPGTAAFHFVWSPSRRRPRQRHATVDAAVAEAERLAAANPGVIFAVYSARAVARRVVTP